MGRRLARLRALSWRERGTLAACAVGLTLVHATLGVLGYARTRRLVERLSMHHAPRAASNEEVTRARAVATLAEIAGRHGAVEATCLRRSLLLYGWLRRRGLQPQLHLGLAGHTGPFQAHAWVELDGQSLLALDAGSRPFVRPPRGPA